MEAFLAQPLDRITYPPRTDPALILAERERLARTRGLLKWAKQELYVMKLYRSPPHGARTMADLIAAELDRRPPSR